MGSDNTMMESVVDLMWTVEEDEPISPLAEDMRVNCGGGGGCISGCTTIACAACIKIVIPNIILNWCNND